MSPRPSRAANPRMRPSSKRVQVNSYCDSGSSVS